MSYEVKVYPDSILRKKSETIEHIDENVLKLLDDMKDIMYSYNGIGLAAEQLGILKRLVVIDTKPGGNNELIKLINPEIIAAEGTYEEHEEGCLSVPGYYDTIKNRKKGVKVKYIDIDGNDRIIETEDFLSVVLQHEIDHLNGILFVDRLSPIRKAIFKKEWKKMQKERSAQQ